MPVLYIHKPYTCNLKPFEDNELTGPTYSQARTVSSLSLGWQMVNNTYLHSDDGVDEEEHQDEETDVRQGLGTHSRKIAIRTECIGSRDSSVVRAPDV